MKSDLIAHQRLTLGRNLTHAMSVEKAFPRKVTWSSIIEFTQEKNLMYAMNVEKAFRQRYNL